jgi:hypothetical protein
MIKKNLELIKCIFDLMIVFAPFIFILDNGVKNFIVIFYVIYLPSLIFNIFYKTHKKKELLFKKSIPIKHNLSKSLKPTQKELTISN